ncbi:hypothetical protein FIBSPDRAFT_958545 [Athelia psychrophila]|uniref:Cytochrome P450 n=1 Tax=Athelia psychrophila TaxID=1759441 RepID=A0A166EEQ2_9AGAM|nr:hypothetical protein FIBSPDRAFT_958545 [Fibularhizoctonia sp. CBS 109695]
MNALNSSLQFLYCTHSSLAGISSRFAISGSPREPGGCFGLFGFKPTFNATKRRPTRKSWVELREVFVGVGRNNREDRKIESNISYESATAFSPPTQDHASKKVSIVDGVSFIRTTVSKSRSHTHPFQIPSFAIFNNIVLFPLYAVVLYILLRAMFKPFFSSQGHPRSVVCRRIRLPARQACRAATVVQDSRGDSSRVLDQTRSSLRMRLLAAPIRQDGRLQGDSDVRNPRFGYIRPHNGNTLIILEHVPHAMRKRIYAPHYASNYLAFFQPEIHDFTHGLVKTLDSETPLLSRLLQAKYSASESMPDRDIVSEVMPQMIAGTDTATISLSYFL